MSKDNLTYYVGTREMVNSVEMIVEEERGLFSTVFLVYDYSEYQVYQLIRKHVKTIR
jgi:hypothetical protein